MEGVVNDKNLGYMVDTTLWYREKKKSKKKKDARQASVAECLRLTGNARLRCAVLDDLHDEGFGGRM